MKRTHHCNELREEHVGQTVTLNGWVHSNRDLGWVIFIDIRDREGRTQAVFDPSDLPADLFETASKLHSESVMSVTGKVRVRPDGTKNEKIDTGLVEVLADKLEVLNQADVLPFSIDDPEVAAKVNEELRLKHRYLDLRRPEMIHNMRLRSRVATATRVFMEEQGFLEIETPTLFKSTPEGAREFLVPSRVHPGQFYALPQSPQQFKQILMCAGVDKYFQLARCYRDEDLRADRQPEFTQIDLEMSFVDEEDIFSNFGGLTRHVFKKVKGIDLPDPFPRMTWEDAWRTYGSDKPDLRFGMKIHDIKSFTDQSEFNAFKSSEVVKGLVVDGGAKYSRKIIDELTDFVKNYKAKGLAWMKGKDGALSGGISKFFSAELQAEMRSLLGINDNDILFLIGDDKMTALKALSLIHI